MIYLGLFTIGVAAYFLGRVHEFSTWKNVDKRHREQLLKALEEIQKRKRIK